jgi:hypothetical protein
VGVPKGCVAKYSVDPEIWQLAQMHTRGLALLARGCRLALDRDPEIYGLVLTMDARWTEWLF